MNTNEKVFEVRTNRLGRFELYQNGKLVQKVCRTCGKVKLASEFPRNSHGHHRPDCRECFNKRQREYLREHKDWKVVYRQRDRARQFGAPDNYTLEDYLELKAFANGRCMISGKKTDKLQVDHVMTLSKKVLGSTKGNIILVCEEVNQAKRDMSLFEFLQSERSRGLVDREQFERTIRYLADANGMTPQEYLDFLYRAEELAKDIKEFFENENKAN